MNNKNKSLFKAIMPWLVVIILLSSLVPLLNTGKSSAVNYNEFVFMYFRFIRYKIL